VSSTPGSAVWTTGQPAASPPAWGRRLLWVMEMQMTNLGAPSACGPLKNLGRSGNRNGSARDCFVASSRPPRRTGRSSSQLLGVAGHCERSEAIPTRAGGLSVGELFQQARPSGPPRTRSRRDTQMPTTTYELPLSSPPVTKSDSPQRRCPICVYSTEHRWQPSNPPETEERARGPRIGVDRRMFMRVRSLK